MPSVGAGVAVGGLILGNKARGKAEDAAAKSEEQQREMSAEERRRKSYQHRREMASMAAELAASGLAETSGSLYKSKEQLDAEKAAVRPVGRTSPMMKVVTPFTMNREETVLDRLLKVSKATQPYSGKVNKITPYNENGGTFAQYFAEKDRVHRREIEWMRRTGLSGIESTRLEGQAAKYTATADMLQNAGKVATEFYDWWKDQ